MNYLVKKKLDKGSVVVACSSDRRFVTPLLVMLKSLLVNFSSNRTIVIYILTNDPKYFSRHKMLKSFQTESIHITPIFVNDQQFQHMKISKGRMTSAAYYRLALPELLPEECREVIYLDSDLIVNTDIGELWDLDMGQHHLLAVQEQGKEARYLSSSSGLLMYKELGIDPGAKQFNTGVMLVNLCRWREDNIAKKVIEFLEQHKEKVRWWDQDGLNAVLAGKWGELDHRWNLLVQIFLNISWEDGPIDDKERYDELINQPYIVHFNGASKPWHWKNKHPYQHLYFRYLDMISPLRRLINAGKQIIVRTIRLFSFEKMRCYYYKKIYRKKILSSKPIICSRDSEFEVHIVTCEKDFLDAMWCLKTFYHYSGLRPKLVIHEDGSLSENSIQKFIKHFVNCRVIRRKDADEDLKRFLAGYQYCQKNRLRKGFFCALKLFDVFYCAETDKLLLLDSDILFFKKPVEIIKYIEEGKSFFNSDYQDAYSKPVSELNKNFGINIFSKVNAGLMFLRKEYYINNLDFMEYYFERMEEVVQNRDINRHEQTLNALLLSKCEAVRLNENYQISRQSIVPDKTVSHHFVDDGSRKNFYQEGLKYLKSNKFLSEFNEFSQNSGDIILN